MHPGSFASRSRHRYESAQGGKGSLLLVVVPPNYKMEIVVRLACVS